MKTKIISAFPACGKSWLFDNQVQLGLKVADSDSSNFSWLGAESGKGKVRNPDFPRNYIEHIKGLIGEVDYILVSSHDEVKIALEDEGLPYILVMPQEKLKAEWIGRCWLRGSPEGFLKMLDKNWDEWNDPQRLGFVWNYSGITYLGSGEYLVDKLWWFDTFSGVSKSDIK